MSKKKALAGIVKVIDLIEDSIRVYEKKNHLVDVIHWKGVLEEAVKVKEELDG